MLKNSHKYRYRIYNKYTNQTETQVDEKQVAKLILKDLGEDFLIEDLGNKLNLEEHDIIAEEINELIERLTTLSGYISNHGGKTKMRPIQRRLDYINQNLSDIRWDLENMMLSDFPDAPLYTSARKYRNKYGIEIISDT